MNYFGTGSILTLDAMVAALALVALWDSSKGHFRRANAFLASKTDTENPTSFIFENFRYQC